MDIRNYFGGKSNRKSALTEVRESYGSPSKHGDVQKKSPKKRPLRIASSSSDEEDPIPKSLRDERKKVSKKKKIIDSSDEEFLPPSASQARPVKRSERITSLEEKKIARGKSTQQSSVAKHTESYRKDLEIIDSDNGQSGLSPTKRKKLTKETLGTVEPSLRKDDPVSKKSAKISASQQKMRQVTPAQFFNESMSAKGKVKGTKAEEESTTMKAKSLSDRSQRKSEHRDSADLKVKEKESFLEKANKEQGKTVEMVSANSHPDLDQMAMGRRKTSSPKKATADGRKTKEQSPKTSGPSTSKLSPQKPVTLKKSKFEKTSPLKSNEAVTVTYAKDDKKRCHKKAQKAVSPGSKAEIAAVKDSKTLCTGSNIAPISTVDSLPWVDKYKPTTVKQLVGQNGEKSPMNKLLGWLRDWPKYHLGEAAKQKRPRPAPWLAQSDGTSFKAALLSGPPGIGKTTCAVMACRELGFQYVEMNASDARNKKLLDVKVAELLGSRQIIQFFGKSADIAKARDSTKVTHVLIMDEVDGMSGNEDRAGLAELIQMIKETRIPIICICNDRQSTKMRSLVNYCFDLRFSRPRVEQIRPRIQTIAFQEKLNLTKEKVDEIIEASNHDVRQTIYNLQLLSQGASQVIQKKDVAMNIFEAARVLMNAGTGLMEKQKMFFVDYSIMPLFVQENCPHIVSSNMSKKERLNAFQQASDSISVGDLVDKVIRSGGAWTLLNEQALFSSILPSMYMNGYLRSMINFPAWLGKNSSKNKHHRLLQQIESHTFLKIAAGSRSLVTERVPIMRDSLYIPLIQKENDGVSEVIATLDEYDLTREDSEEIAELGTWPDMEDYRKNVSSKVKSALTRAFNKHSHLLPYAVGEVSKKRGRGIAEPEFERDEEGNLVEVGGGDELNDDNEDENDEDTVITTSKPTSSKSSASRGGGRGARSLRGTGSKVDRGRGRGRGR